MFLIENICLEEDEEEDDDEYNLNLEAIAAAKSVMRPDFVDGEQCDGALLSYLELAEVSILCVVKE
jgi:hypothetical protein